MYSNSSSEICAFKHVLLLRNNVPVHVLEDNFWNEVSGDNKKQNSSLDA